MMKCIFQMDKRTTLGSNVKVELDYIIVEVFVFSQCVWGFVFLFN